MIEDFRCSKLLVRSGILKQCRLHLRRDSRDKGSLDSKVCIRSRLRLRMSLSRLENEFFFLKVIAMVDAPVPILHSVGVVFGNSRLTSIVCTRWRHLGWVLYIM